MTVKRHAAIDLFSGCGGLSAGLVDAGFEVVAAVEKEPLACSTFRLNHKRTLLLERDITKIRPTSLMKKLGLKPGQLALLAGCPPCQGFSRLRTLNGSKSVTEPMNDLIFQFLKFVKVFRPKAIMMENVPGLARDSRIEVFQRQIHRMGYKSDFKVLDASDYGTPQRRKRLVLLAIKGKKPEFAHKSGYRKTVRWAFAKLQNSSRCKSDPLHNYKENRADHVIKLIRSIPKDGGSRTDLPASKQLDCHKKCDGFKDIYGRMRWSEPSPTITGGCINPSKGRFLHPTKNRAITLREAALLQGFPIEYQFDLSRGKHPVAQLIGNAFPPSFAESHAREILKKLIA